MLPFVNFSVGSKQVHSFVVSNDVRMMSARCLVASVVESWHLRDVVFLPTLWFLMMLRISLI